MTSIPTERLALVELPPSVLRRRIQESGFSAEVDLGEGPATIRFPPEWPGDALGLLPPMVAVAERGEAWPPTLTVVERETGVAVGMLGCKGFPDAEGGVEIGYGMNAGEWGRGLGTEAVAAFAAWLLSRPDVRAVRAECRRDNVGSIRVLEKSGFVRTGERDDLEDGPLLLYRRDGGAP